jgi:hypothetical protein
MPTASSPARLLRDALVSGSIASVLSTAALALRGKGDVDDAAAPVNGPSQWIWGRHAPHRNGFSLRHTVVGYGIHHAASVFWAVLYELLCSGKAGVRCSPATAAMVTSATANVVDFQLTPQRLRPGFEKRLSKRSLLLVYGAFALGLAATRLLHRR